ncbi:hypothetical protein [Haloarcula laminariae]|uniref:hypothetical protein n=1 Tax=Haloarcula laminariae TaxID=2961577 RepID=UPI0021C97743|nr:hypothetical protein [Halomicroarcula laminariae]
MSLENLAIEKQKELLDLWENELDEAFPYGIQISSSPIIDDPKIIILGRNPGIGKKELEKGPPHSSMLELQDENSTFGFPKHHDYIVGGSSYRIAKRMRNIVFKENPELLSETIEMNRDFLRTPNKSALQAWKEQSADDNPDILEQYNSIIKKTVQDLVSQGNPNLIISFTGYSDNEMYPMEEMRKIYDFEPVLESQYRVKKRNRDKNGQIRKTEYRATYADLGETKFIGLTPHLSNPNIPKPVQKMLIKFISDKMPS